MRLITAHRILIGAAIAFFVFFALVSLLRQDGRASGTAPLVQAVVSIAVAIGLVLYYRTLSRWGK